MRSREWSTQRLMVWSGYVLVSSSMSEIGTWATLASGGACGPEYGRSRSLYVPKDLVTSTLQQLCSGEQARGRACGVLDTCCDLRCRYALISLSSRTCVVDKLCEVSVARTYFSGCGAPLSVAPVPW